MSDLVAGRVGRPHGLDGSFYAIDIRPRLIALDAFTVRGRPVTVVRRAGTEARPILRLGGVESREGAEALRGEELRVARSDAPPLAEDEWLADDLVGCEVFDGERSLGSVQRVLAYPSCELLEVGTLLVPLIGDAVSMVDVAGRRIEVDGEFLGLAPEG